MLGYYNIPHMLELMSVYAAIHRITVIMRVELVARTLAICCIKWLCIPSPRISLPDFWALKTTSNNILQRLQNSPDADGHRSERWVAALRCYIGLQAALCGCSVIFEVLAMEKMVDK